MYAEPLLTITNRTVMLTIITTITNHKVGVSFDVIGHVALENEVVNTVCSDGSVVGVVYGAVLDVGPIHGTTQVEVDGIATKPEGLASISKLRMVNPEKQNLYIYLNYSGCNYSLAK